MTQCSSSAVHWQAHTLASQATGHSMCLLASCLRVWQPVCHWVGAEIAAPVTPESLGSLGQATHLLLWHSIATQAHEPRGIQCCVQWGALAGSAVDQGPAEWCDRPCCRFGGCQYCSSNWHPFNKTIAMHRYMSEWRECPCCRSKTWA